MATPLARCASTFVSAGVHKRTSHTSIQPVYPAMFRWYSLAAVMSTPNSAPSCLVLHRPRHEATRAAPSTRSVATAGRLKSALRGRGSHPGALAGTDVGWAVPNVMDGLLRLLRGCCRQTNISLAGDTLMLLFRVKILLEWVRQGGLNRRRGRTSWRTPAWRAIRHCAERAPAARPLAGRQTSGHRPHVRCAAGGHCRTLPDARIRGPPR